MKNFVNYINTINKDPFLKPKAKFNTAILMPELDTTEGIYRSLLPSYVLNGIDDLRIIVMGIREKVGLSPNEPDFDFDEKLVNEVDHIVFPFVSYPLQNIIETIRDFATRNFKKEMYFSYYIDANFYAMADSYPHAREYKLAKMIDNIEENIKAVDQVIVTNKTFKTYLIEKLKERHPNETFKTNITFQPLFILPDLMKVEFKTSKDRSKKKILLIGDEYQFSDINFIKGILKDTKVQYAVSTEIHIIGFNGVREKKNFLSGLNFEYHERVSYFKYFELIAHIAPDVLLIPANKNSFNRTSKNYIKYIEFAYLNVPVIAPNIDPYSNLISTNQNGFLCDDKGDYFFQIGAMFTTPEKFEASIGPAYALAASEYNIVADNNIKNLRLIYFPHAER